MLLIYAIIILFSDFILNNPDTKSQEYAIIYPGNPSTVQKSLSEIYYGLKCAYVHLIKAVMVSYLRDIRDLKVPTADIHAQNGCFQGFIRRNKDHNQAAILYSSTI